MPFNINLDTDNPNFAILLDTVETEVKPMIPEKQYIQKHYAAHLKLMLLNLLKAYRQNRQRYVAYSNRRNTYYPQKVGGQGLKISYDPFRHIVQLLEKLEYITTKRGFSFQGGRSSNSRMRATDKLKELFRPARNTFRNMNCILLKDAGGNYIPYTETTNIHRIRENLSAINDQLDKHFIGLYIPDIQLEQLNMEMQKKNRRHMDLSKTLLHRTFSRGSFDLGGRFYGGFWIQLPKQYRPFVKIDHKGTESRDYSATVFSLMYLEKGFEVPEGDAYLFPGADPRDRDVIKDAAQMLVNTPCRQKALQAINYEVVCKRFTHRKYTAGEIVSSLELKHEAIRDLFYRDLGVLYQRKESEIAEAVMLRFVSLGKPILPIHDGFIAKREDIEFLEQAMTEEVVVRYGHPMPFKADNHAKLTFLLGGNDPEAYSIYYKFWDERQRELNDDIQVIEENDHPQSYSLALVA